MTVDYHVLLSGRDPSPLLERWRGGTAALRGYTVSHRVLEIRVHREGREGGLRILCGDVQSLAGPAKWEGVVFGLERFGDEMVIFRDRRAGFEVVAGVVGADDLAEPRERGESVGPAGDAGTGDAPRPYRASDLRTIDPLEWIRSHPERFFPRGIVSAGALASDLVWAVLILTDAPVHARRKDGWRLIGGADWFPPEYRERAAEYFSRVFAFPEAGQNAMRPGVLLTAFARDVFTVDGSRLVVIKGTAPRPEEVRAWLSPIPACERIVGFGLDEPPRG